MLDDVKIDSWVVALAEYERETFLDPYHGGNKDK